MSWFSSNAPTTQPAGNSGPELAHRYFGYRPPAPATTEKPPMSFGPDTDWSNPANVTAYFQSRGVTPNDSSAAYWAQKFNSPEFANDKNYFWQRLQAADEFGGGGGGGAGGVGIINSNDPVAGQFGRPASPYASNPFGEQFSTPDLPDALKTPFTAPTQAELEASPGYQARLAAGTQGLTRNLAAHTGLGGGTLKALERYRQDYASNEYNNLYGQKLGTRQENVGEFQNLVGNANQQFQNRYGQWQGEQARTLNDYLTNYAVNRNYATDWWNQTNTEAQRGLTAQQIAAGAGG